MIDRCWREDTGVRVIKPHTCRYLPLSFLCILYPAFFSLWTRYSHRRRTICFFEWICFAQWASKRIWTRVTEWVRKHTIQNIQIYKQVSFSMQCTQVCTNITHAHSYSWSPALPLQTSLETRSSMVHPVALSLMEGVCMRKMNRELERGSWEVTHCSTDICWNFRLLCERLQWNLSGRHSLHKTLSVAFLS